MRAWILLMPFVVALVACAGPSVATPRAGSERAKLIQYLAGRNLASDELAAGDGSLLVVPAWGARIMGAYFDDANVLWVPEDLDPSDPKEQWNKGGARTWLSPEGHAKGFYFSADWSDWKCPVAMDNGDYKPAKASRAGHVAYANDCRMTANDGTAYSLRITREIGACPSPGGVDPSARGVKFVGISFAHRLKNLGERAINREIDLWSLMMVKGEATLVVPVRPDAGGYLFRDYFEPVPPELVSTNNGEAITMRVDGARRYKIGQSAARCKGLTGSIGRLSDGTWQLLVKRFPWDKDGTYADRPKYDPDRNGDAIQTYNHHGEKGVHFYEIECHGPAWTLKPGDEREHATEILIYRGPEAAIKGIGTTLFGVEIARLKLFQ